MEKSFSRWKQQRLSSIDLSRKGSIDSEIYETVSYINSLDEFFTTSSCSGRVVLYSERDYGKDGPKKRGCDWLLVSHEPVQLEHLDEALTLAEEGNIVMKFEAFVLHVQCRSLEDAQLVHEAAVASGHRNSGITIGKNGKIISAVRSTHGLEVPLSENKKMFASREYLEFLVNTANAKMEENFRRIERFAECFRERINLRERSTPQLHSTTQRRVRPVCKATQTADSDTITSATEVSECGDGTDVEHLDLFDGVT